MTFRQKKKKGKEVIRNADNPRKRGPHDRKRQSRQPHEVRYAPKRKTPRTINWSKKR